MKRSVDPSIPSPVVEPLDLHLLEDIEARLRVLNGDIEGSDSDDREYSSLVEFWKEELLKRASASNKAGLNLEWYSKAYDYWEDEEKCPISDDGVLAGFGHLTPADVKGSIAFLNELKKLQPGLRFELAADCGAGIGRVTKHLLLPKFNRVDMIEQSHRLIHSAANYIGSPDSNRVGFIEIGLQDFAPGPIYDVIWIQWVVGHLLDTDYVQFFRRCGEGLRENGVVILKDNCSESLTFMVDREDSSVARHIDYHKLLLEKAGLKIVKVRRQTGFPNELCPVVMFAMVPDEKPVP